MSGAVYLIPCNLAEGAIDCIPAYVLENVKKCTIIFAENERTTRRFLKLLDKQIVIDDFIWYTIQENNEEQAAIFRSLLGKENIAIISEAGCPGIADPGQHLIQLAQQQNITVHPLVGPNSIILALMASGMNGQEFEFVGYLPIENSLRNKKIKELESSSLAKNSTKIFIETPYRNKQLAEALIQHCAPSTKLCIAINITAGTEMIVTKTIRQWQNNLPEMHKIPAIFLLMAG